MAAKRFIKNVMCLLCIEVAKEAIKPRDFWRNYREIPEEHVDELIKVVSKTNPEYQAELAGFSKDSLEE